MFMQCYVFHIHLTIRYNAVESYHSSWGINVHGSLVYYPRINIHMNMFYFPFNIDKYCDVCIIVSPACVSGGDIYRDHFSRQALVSQNFLSRFSQEPCIQASFQILGTEHQYGQLYHVTQFPICRMSTSSLTQLRIFLT